MRQVEINLMAEEIENQPGEEEIKVSFLEKLKIHKFKILSGIVGVLVFAGAVFGAYRFGQRQVQPASKPAPTPLPSEAPAKEGDPTANWKTYTNTKYDYSIRYPEESSFLYGRLSSENDEFSLQYCPSFKEKGEGICGAPGFNYLIIDIINEGYPAAEILEGTFEGNYPYKPPKCIRKDPRTKITRGKFQGKDSIRYEYNLDSLSFESFCSNEKLGVLGEQLEIFVLNDQQLIMIGIRNAKSKEVKTALNKVLSTFKFLE